MIPLIWMLIFQCCGQYKSKSDMGDRVIISFLVLFFLIYPNVLRNFFSLFSCVSINGDLNRTRLVGALSIICYDTKHLNFLTIAVIASVIILFVFPLIAFIILYRYSKKKMLRSYKVASTFGYLYGK